MSFSAVSDAQVIRKAAATMAPPKIRTVGTLASSPIAPVTMRRRRMGAGAQMAAQPDTSSQFLKGEFLFTGRSSCRDGDVMDRGGPYRKAIADAPMTTGESRRSEDDSLQPASG
jgi:hypothetical protein